MTEQGLRPYLVLGAVIAGLVVSGPGPATAQFMGLCTLVEKKPQEGEATVGIHRAAAPLEVLVGWMVLGAGTGDKVRGEFHAVEVTTPEGQRIENYLIDTAVYEASKVPEGTAVWGHFALSRPEGGWPSGRYRLDLRLGERLVARCPFEVVAAGTESGHQGLRLRQPADGSDR